MCAEVEGSSIVAWRLHKSVKRGELDNRTPGRVTGRVWLVDCEKPLTLELKGNALKDLAGCFIRFSNPTPEKGEAVDLRLQQRGVVGDITGSRKVRVPDVPIEEMMRLSKEGKKFPEHLGNCLYIEWFSEANGRVVIESADYEVTLSAPKWGMTEEQQQDQLRANQEAIRSFLDRLAGAMPSDSDEEEPEDEEPYKPMNEFEWEKFMKESDKRTDRYMQLLEKYEGHPDQEKLVAHEMGWTWLEEALDADERGKLEDDEKDDNPFDSDEVPELVPDPLTEGTDWVRDESGHPQHPLVLRTIKVATGMWHRCKDKGLLGETGDPELQDMVFQAEMTGAKLAGGLNSLAYDHAPEGGFVVACLKRALTYLHKAIGLTDKVAAKSLVPEEELIAYRNDLFGIREAILQLMERYRHEAS